MNATTGLSSSQGSGGGTNLRSLPLHIERQRGSRPAVYRVYIDAGPDCELVYIGRVVRCPHGDGWDVVCGWAPEIHGHWPTKTEAIRNIEARWFIDGPGKDEPGEVEA